MACKARRIGCSAGPASPVRQYDYTQGKFIPVHFDKQILPGTFEYTLHYFIDNELDLSVFDLRYCNDDTEFFLIQERQSIIMESKLTYQGL